MTEGERLWHALVDWEIAAKDAVADLRDAQQRVAEASAAHLSALIKYRKYLEDRLADHDGDL